MTAARAAQPGLRVFIVALVAVAVMVVVVAPGAPRANAAQAELSGSTFGIELCPQLLCGAATFIGYFGGEVDGRRSSGWWMIAARHDALPEAGASAAVTGGRWSLSIAGTRTAGTVVGGSIVNNGDETFTITVALDPAETGGRSLQFSGLLSHRTFPPTTRGTLVARPGD